MILVPYQRSTFASSVWSTIVRQLSSSGTRPNVFGIIHPAMRSTERNQSPSSKFAANATSNTVRVCVSWQSSSSTTKPYISTLNRFSFMSWQRQTPPVATLWATSAKRRTASSTTMSLVSSPFLLTSDKATADYSSTSPIFFQEQRVKLEAQKNLYRIWVLLRIVHTGRMYCSNTFATTQKRRSRSRPSVKKWESIQMTSSAPCSTWAWSSTGKVNIWFLNAKIWSTITWKGVGIDQRDVRFILVPLNGSPISPVPRRESRLSK